MMNGEGDMALTQASGGAAAEPAPIPLRPPPGMERLPREFVIRHQRQRIIEALAHEVVAHGYREVTVSGIVKSAGVARNTFYENFGGKEECFLAASDHAGQEAMRQVAEAVRQCPPDWPTQVREGIAAFLAYATSESALARVFIVESLSAGPRASENYERTMRVVVSLFRQGRPLSPHGDELPETLEETIVGGIFWIVYQRIVAGHTADLEGLLPELVEFALAPYLGAGEAKQIGEGGRC
jgi:AcrR family transcriptional regulator